jgi:membrane fusion protein (multidrug efflux system)
VADQANSSANAPADKTQKPDQPPQGQAGQPPAKKKKNPFKNPVVVLIIIVVVVGLAVGGFFYWLHARQYVKTDDAFVDAHIVRLAPQISGQVSRVLVDDNQLVEPGQPIVEIDSSAAQNALNQAVSQKAQAQAQEAQAQANTGVSAAAYKQAQDQTAGLQAQADSAVRDADRYQNLATSNPRAVAAQQVDEMVFKAQTALRQRDAQSRQAEGALAQNKAAKTQVKAAQAAIGAADAEIAQNQLTLSHAQVIAPVEGFITQKNVAPGNYVQPGQQLLAIVPKAMWVTANFKETQLKNMRVGQPVDMKIDACPTKLTGKVVSIQRGSGEAFALLPAENATGNFVKVVQRVPVKLSFDDIPKDCPIGPGLSVMPRVKVR